MEQLKGIDEEEMLETMPERLHRDVAMDMHFEILKKVKLFEGCDEQLLIDLVLYLRNPLKNIQNMLVTNLRLWWQYRSFRSPTDVINTLSPTSKNCHQH